MSDKSQEAWDGHFHAPEGSPEEIERWRQLRERMIVVARQFRWSKTEVSRRSGIPQGTLWGWLDGSYRGVIANVSDKVSIWLASLDELNSAAARIPLAPGYVETPTARRLTDMLIFAQMMPAMVLGVLGSGMGKTMTADEYVRAHPGALKVTMRPTTKSVQRMLLVIADALEIRDGRVDTREAAIGKKLKRNGRNTLLIVDEAQNLLDESVNQLRYLLDEYGVGIALLGNEELYGRFGDREPKPAFAQLHSRMGMRLRQLQPQPGDIDTLMSAWGVEEPEAARLVRAIGRKPGGLRQVTMTLKLAGMYAAGEARETISAADIQAALTNRGVEG